MAITRMSDTAELDNDENWWFPGDPAKHQNPWCVYDDQGQLVCAVSVYQPHWQQIVKEIAENPPPKSSLGNDYDDGV